MNKSRLGYIDFLKFIGLLCIIIAHTGAPEWMMMLRNFDVPMMVIISAMLGSISFYKYSESFKRIFRYCFERIKRLVIPTWIFLIIFFVFLYTQKRTFSFEYYYHSFCLTRYGINYVWIILIYLYSALLTPLFHKIKKFSYSWIYIAVLYIFYEFMYYFGVGINNRFVDTTFYYIIPYGTIAFLGFCYTSFSKKDRLIIMAISSIFFILCGIIFRIETGMFQNVQISKYPPRLYYIGYGVFVSFLLLELCNIKPLKFYENKWFRFISNHSMWIYLWHILMLELYSIFGFVDVWYIKFVVVYIASMLMTFVVNRLLDILEKYKKNTCFKIFEILIGVYQMKLLAFGEVLWDVYPDNKYIGGAPLNFAAHSAKLGASSYLLSAVGDDELAKDTLQSVKKFNINTDYIGVVSGKQTGKCLVTLDEKSVPSYNLLNDVAWDYISFNAKNDNFDALYFGTLALRSGHNRETLKALLQNHRFNEVFVDVNIRLPFYSDVVIDFAFKNATILKISDEELETTLKAVKIDFSDDFSAVSRSVTAKYSNIKILIITRGGEGAAAFDAVSGEFYEVPSEKAEVVSTVGAGDSFSAAFLNKYSNGTSVAESLGFASRLAAFVVSNYDAVPDYNGYD